MLASVHSFPRGSTLKATTVVFSNEVCSTFTVMSSRALLTDHVCMYIRHFSLCILFTILP